MKYVCSIDVGGTFTDCVIVDENGKLTVSKVPSTPPHFEKGFFESIRKGAESLGMKMQEFVPNVVGLFHGTTVATNAAVQRKGCKVGMITTAGHRDVLAMMRAFGRIAGLTGSDLIHIPVTGKPDPIIPKTLIEEIDERIDCSGEVLIHLDEKGVEKAIRRLLDQGVEAISICFLWSIVNPDHERRAKEICRRIAPRLFVSCSHEVSMREGEYERFVSSALNCYIGPLTAAYYDKLVEGAQALGYGFPPLIMQCTGGLLPVERAKELAVWSIGSGPVGGAIGTAFLGAIEGWQNIIATDMGGTTFDVAIIYQGAPIRRVSNTIGRYQYFADAIDVRSMGSGGGSIIWIDELRHTLRVGPQSAGADPGPVCYMRGGTEPTITDADVLLGYINPDFFLGGAMPLNKAAAEDALTRLGAKMGMSAVEAAAGARRVVDLQMADLIRQMTVQSGLDPRSFVLYAYGGAGPTHAGVYAPELGIKEIIVPLGNVCSSFSALGIAAGDILHIHELAYRTASPFNSDEMNSRFEEMERRARDDLRRDGVAEQDMNLSRFADMSYIGQVNEHEVPVPGGKLTSGNCDQLIDRFDVLYETLYGKGAGYRAGGVQIITLGVRASGKTVAPAIVGEAKLEREPVKEAIRPKREVYWPEYGKFVSTAIFFGPKLKPGNEIRGPAVIEEPDTTIVVHPGQSAQVTKYGSVLVQAR